MSVLWKDCTTKGAFYGGFAGLLSAVTLTVISPVVWEATFGNPEGSALFPYSSPAIFSMPIAFITIWIVSLLDKSENARKEREEYLAQEVRSETGIGADGVSGH
jgi:cation/acetate symporter